MDFPYLKYFSSFREEKKSLTIFTEDIEIEIETENPKILKEMLLKMDGNTHINNINNDYIYEDSEFKSLLEQLNHFGIVNNIQGNTTLIVEPQYFAKVCRQIFPEWKKNIFTMNFWHKLTSGQLSISSFAGWLLESFHFIEGATKRLSLVTATSNKNRKIRELFSQHFIEEYNHQLFFMKALQRLGFTKEQVLSHIPLPSTLAIINHMREIARNDSIAYAACSAFLESTGEDRKDGMLFYDSLTQHYDKDSKDIIQPLIDHAFLDEEYGHNEWLEKVCTCVVTLNTERANEALTAAQMLVETLKMWTWDMNEHYKDIPFDEVVNNNRYR